MPALIEEHKRVLRRRRRLCWQRYLDDWASSHSVPQNCVFFVSLISSSISCLFPISTKTNILGPAVYEKLPYILIVLRICSQVVFYLQHLRMSQYTTWPILCLLWLSSYCRRVNLVRDTLPVETSTQHTNQAGFKPLSNTFLNKKLCLVSSLGASVSWWKLLTYWGRWKVH